MKRREKLGKRNKGIRQTKLTEQRPQGRNKQDAIINQSQLHRIWGKEMEDASVKATETIHTKPLRHDMFKNSFLSEELNY